jgi:cephalosporin-C deacetylase-like acetyl esterase
MNLNPQRSTVFVLGTLMLGGLMTLPGAARAPTSDPNGSTHFAYDTSAALNLTEVSTRAQDGVIVRDITYTWSNGDIVPAYLIIPKAGGKFAGVVWGHWLMPGASNSNRDEFLQEAIALAPSGVVSLLVDSPQARPGFKPTPNSVLVAQQVVDLRRAVDLLLSRGDVDAKRIAYVGHSWDAGTGAILDALDKRLAAFVFMSGPQSMMEYVLTSDSPRMVPMRKTTDMAKVEQSMKVTSWSDPGSYADKLGPAPALFQYGLHDEEWVPLKDAKDYVAMASEPKTVKYYEADHALNAKATADRDAFLRKILAVTQ